MDEDPANILYSNLATTDLLIIVLFLINMFFTYKNKGDIFAGHNKILTYIIVLFLILYLVLSYLLIIDAESDEETISAFTAFGFLFSSMVLLLYLLVYVFITRNIKADSKVTSASALTPTQAVSSTQVSNPLLKKQGGGRHKRRTYSKK
jgi:cytochrome bd-type quinol oxidase subunit 2